MPSREVKLYFMIQPLISAYEGAYSNDFVELLKKVSRFKVINCFKPNTPIKKMTL